MDHNERDSPREYAQFPDSRTMFDKVVFWIEVGAFVTEVFLNKGAGRDQPGRRGVLTFVGLPAWAISTKSDSCLLFWYVWLVAAIVFRLGANMRAHSRYPGLIRGLHRYFSDRTAAALQAMLVTAGGVAIFQVDQPLGSLIALSGVCLGLNECLIRMLLLRLKIALTNARWEAEQQAALFRDVR